MYVFVCSTRRARGHADAKAGMHRARYAPVLMHDNSSEVEGF